MPFPPDKDSNVFSGRSLRVKKRSQVLSSTGLQYFEEQSRKYGTTENCRGDDIMGAMTRLNFQNTETHKQLTEAYLPKLDTEMSIFNSNPQPTNLNFDELLSSTAIESSPPSTDTSGDTGGWADSVSTHDISPNNLISLSESPPNLSDEGREPKLGWTIKEQKKYPFAHPSTVSPTISRRGLFNCQFDISQNPEIHQSQVSLFDAHRSPTYSRNRNTSNPPLPHQIQSHFFGVPKAEFMQASQASEVNLNESEFYCGFDMLWKKNVITVGFETGLDIYEISKGGLSRASRLEGLRGGVFNAKIIPWTANYRNPSLFPLIALVVHGPAKKTHEAQDIAVVSEDIMANHTGIMQDTSWRINTSTDIEYYQTTVELYSLSGSKKHIGTLLSLPRIPLAITDKNQRVRVPPPVGSLAILADCGNLVITSGITGETWIFKQLNSGEISSQLFRCIGKIWTTVQHVTKTEEVSEGINDWQKMESLSERKQSNTSIISLNGRWLAFCPPAPSTQTSLRGVVIETNSAVKIPGFATNTTPQLPEINCSIDTPGVESLMKQIAQVGTQNFIRAGNYIAQQGFQAWTNYRNKPASTTQKIQINQSVSSSLSTKDPGLISIIDLDMSTQSDTSSTSSSLHHHFTFRVPYGCSFLSFSPNGLSLFTASSKGDIQFVWDLMQIRYPKYSFQIFEQIATGTQGPRVRQIARFSRMTVARIVDVVWAAPNGERAAMVTEPGTIHVLDLPTSAFKWPPPSSKIFKSEDHTDQSNSSTVRATSVATSAVNTLWTAARPLVSNRRRSSTCLSARSVSMTASQSTQTLAAGISRSVGAATEKMNEIRKSVGIKLHLPRSSVAPNRACVVFQNKKHNDVIFALAGSMIRIYTVRNQKAYRPSNKQKTPVKIFTEYKIPRFSSFRSLSDSDQELRLDEQFEFTEKEIDEIGQKSRQVSLSHRLTPSIESSIPHAEIESNAPYRPFHTDKCVSLYTYNDLPLLSLDISSNDEIEGSLVISQKKNHTWVFGKSIMTTEIDVGKQSHSENKIEHLETSHELSSEASQSVMRISDNADNAEHIIFTTRIQKSPSPSNIKGTAYEDGFFEDDCEMLDFAKLRR